ncbi:putative bifunctional methylenetetrahydrofolate dehydrogenase/cyclohydrolase 2, partial [Crenichthys baileyi]
MADMDFTDLIAVFYLWRAEKRRRRRRPWVHQILQGWEQFGDYHHLLQELRLDDGRFQRFFRLSRTQFEDLLSCVGRRIGLQDTNYRGCIPTAERLSICLRHAAVVISGTELARQIHREIQRDVEELVAHGNMRPHLGVILVGDDPASHTYVKNKTRAATILGISSDTVVRPSSVSQEELLELIDKMNRDWRVSGLLVQLPLPDHINERAVCNAIAPEKDVDGFHIVNIGKLCLDQRSMVPATPAAVWEMIKRA